MSRSENSSKVRARSLTRAIIWLGAGLAGAAVLCGIVTLALSPFANRAATDDAPIVVAELMLFAFAALAMMASIAVFTCLLLGTVAARLWHHWRPGHGDLPAPPRLPPKPQPPGTPAGPTGDGGAGPAPDRDPHPVAC